MAEKRLIQAKNVGSSDAPAHGIVEISDVSYDSVFGTSYVEVRRPTADNVKTIAIVAEGVIPQDGFGAVYVSFPTWVSYDPADGVPALNEQWGPANGTYLAKKNKIGLLAIPMESGDDPPEDDLSLMILEVCRA